MHLFDLKEGIDPSITAYALKQSTVTGQEVAGGEITSGNVDIYNKKIEDFGVFKLTNVAKKLLVKKYLKILINKSVSI
jgi:hypothetical protein